jgi:hypothetical protein
VYAAVHVYVPRCTLRLHLEPLEFSCACAAARSTAPWSRGCTHLDKRLVHQSGSDTILSTDWKASRNVLNCASCSRVSASSKSIEPCLDRASGSKIHRQEQHSRRNSCNEYVLEYHCNVAILQYISCSIAVHARIAIHASSKPKLLQYTWRPRC